jgi:hypothetical protein
MLPHSVGENGTVVESVDSDNKCSHERIYSFTSLRSDMASPPFVPKPFIDPFHDFLKVSWIRPPLDQSLMVFSCDPRLGKPSTHLLGDTTNVVLRHKE